MAARGPTRTATAVADPVDSCITVPGTVEFHGCPEQTDVVIGEGGIEILQTIYFRTNRDVIESRSFGLLDNVARLLNEHPEVNLVRIEGHTDTRGRLANNMRLSQARAESVMRYLVEHGVSAARLEAQGYGPTRLIVENARTPG
jgi:OOP family OmpA-OmpF porin